MSGIYSVRAEEVEWQLQYAPFQYPTLAEADPEHGFRHVTVIPMLFEWVTQELRGDLPGVATAASFLMASCEPRYAKDPKVRRRGEKLVLDFYRDLHTYGLLCECYLFGQVLYQKALDVNNVDYLARLTSRLAAYWGRPDPVGIQAQMRARWTAEGDPWDAIKAGRRAGRGATLERESKLYYLTNRERPAWKHINRVWLFGPQHIKDLADEIAADLAPTTPNVIAIQTRMEF